MVVSLVINTELMSFFSIPPPPPQDVDCLCVDGGLVVTASLDGHIRVWDANPMKRRCITVINRRYILKGSISS